MVEESGLQIMSYTLPVEGWIDLNHWKKEKIIKLGDKLYLGRTKYSVLCLLTVNPEAFKSLVKSYEKTGQFIGWLDRKADFVHMVFQDEPKPIICLSSPEKVRVDVLNIMHAAVVAKKKIEIVVTKIIPGKPGKPGKLGIAFRYAQAPRKEKAQ